jgi:hypothetical protein
MGRPLESDIAGAPARWLLVFDREAATWWMSLLALGRYKHVRAIGYVYDADAYLFYDVQLAGTTLQLARGKAARQLISEWIAHADVLAIEPGSARHRQGVLRPLLCTTSIAHLVGLPGALRPDALFRQALRNGAEWVHHYGRTEGAAAPARPDAGPADGNGAATAADCAAE